MWSRDYLTSAVVDTKKQMSLRGAKRRGNLYQVVATQIETTPRCQEVAAPCGLAMTSVLLAIRKGLKLMATIVRRLYLLGGCERARGAEHIDKRLSEEF